ncbi:MAG: hypothetical protein ABSC93_14490 [Bryobacteraceae bacterium]
MIDHFKLLMRIYWQPSAAMSAILDQGSLLFASVAVLAISWLFRSGLLIGFYMPLLVLAVAYVPGVLLLAGLLGRLGGGLGSVFQRDYSPLLTCTAMAWSAANLPLALIGWMLSPPVVFILMAVEYLYFLVLMFFVVRTVFGAENRIAVAVVCLSWIPVVAASFLWGPLTMPRPNISSVSFTSSVVNIPPPSSASKRRWPSIPEKPMRISNWAASRVSRGALPTR